MNCFLAQLKYLSDEAVDETKLFYVWMSARMQKNNEAIYAG